MFYVDDWEASITVAANTENANVLNACFELSWQELNVYILYVQMSNSETLSLILPTVQDLTLPLYANDHNNE